jgi:hypothetical protein
MTDAELQSRRSRHPELVYAMGSLRYPAAILAGLNSAQRTALLSGEGLSIRIEELSPQEQQYARLMLGDVRRMRRSVPPSLGGGWIDWRADRDAPKTPLSIRLTGAPDRPGIRMVLVPVVGMQQGTFDLLHAEAPQVRPPWMEEVLKERERKERQERERFLEGLRNDPQFAKKISLTAWLEVPDEERPGRTVRRACDLSDTLMQVADRTGLSIIGDYDPCWDDYYSHLDRHNPNAAYKQYLGADVADVPVWGALEVVRKRFRVEWDRRGSVIFVRSPRTPFALMDGVDVLNPPRVPDYWDQLRRIYKPGEKLPGVTYGP